MVSDLSQNGKSFVLVGPTIISAHPHRVDLIALLVSQKPATIVQIARAGSIA